MVRKTKIRPENKARYDELLDMMNKNETPIFDEVRYNEIIKGIDEAFANARKTMASFDKLFTPMDEPTKKKLERKAKPRYKRKGA